MRHDDARESTWAFYRESQRFWAGIDRRRRARVRKAIWKGEQVTDPRDADLAVAWARLLQESLQLDPLRRYRWVHRGLVALVLVGLVVAPSVGVADVLPLLLVGALLAFHSVFARALTKTVKSRAKQAEGANLHLLGHSN